MHGRMCWEQGRDCERKMYGNLYRENTDQKELKKKANEQVGMMNQDVSENRKLF